MRRAPARRVIVWLDPSQVDLARTVVELAGLEIVGVGSPARGRAGELAAQLMGERAVALDDLRSTLATQAADVAWLLDPGDFGAGGIEDATTAEAAWGRGTLIACPEPIPASALQIDGTRWRPPGSGSSGLLGARSGIWMVPLIRGSRPFRDATDVAASFGPARALTVEAWARGEECSLGSLLFAACDVVLGVMGEPESIDAAWCPQREGAARALSGETLRGLAGYLQATMRFADGRIAGLAVGQTGGRWAHAVTLVGEGGRLRIFQDGMEWISPTGEKLDEQRRRARGNPAVGAAGEIAEQLKRLLDPGLDMTRPCEGAMELAQTAMLSARTGQGESVATIRRMAGVA